MPVEVTKYLCQFKCGTKAKSQMWQILSHEDKCWKNPETKSCTTCKHEIYKKDGDGFRQWMDRGCEKLDYEKFEELMKSCEYHTTPKIHIQPIKNCPFWEQKLKP